MSGQLALYRFRQQPVERSGDQIGDHVEGEECDQQPGDQKQRQQQPLQPIERFGKHAVQKRLKLTGAEVDQRGEDGDVDQQRHHHVGANARLKDKGESAQEIKCAVDRIVSHRLSRAAG